MSKPEQTNEITEGRSELSGLVRPRHPTVEECEAVGRGPRTTDDGAYEEGWIPNTPEERSRFEAYMRGHCWNIGNYDDEKRCFDTVSVRMLYGIWRDRGALPTTWPNV